jgi:hypothetical protein
MSKKSYNIDELRRLFIKNNSNHFVKTREVNTLLMYIIILFFHSKTFYFQLILFRLSKLRHT